jgi:hypothetical protein
LEGAKQRYAKTDNYYVMDREGDQVVLTRSKTAKIYGTRKLNVPEPLKLVVRQSLELIPRKWLLAQVRDPQKPWETKFVTVQLGAVLGKGAGCSLLRKIAKSTWSENNEGNDDKLARLMGHSLDVAEANYNVNRKPLSENSMFQL